MREGMKKNRKIVYGFEQFKFLLKRYSVFRILNS